MQRTRKLLVKCLSLVVLLCCACSWQVWHWLFSPLQHGWWGWLTLACIVFGKYSGACRLRNSPLWARWHRTEMPHLSVIAISSPSPLYIHDTVNCFFLFGIERMASCIASCLFLYRQAVVQCLHSPMWWCHVVKINVKTKNNIAHSLTIKQLLFCTVGNMWEVLRQKLWCGVCVSLASEDDPVLIAVSHCWVDGLLLLDDIYHNNMQPNCYSPST